MTRGRGKRPLTDEERRLWDLVARSAKPLKPGPAPAPPAAEPEAPPAAKPQSPKPKPSPPPATARPPAAGQAPGAIDRRTRNRLSRGNLDIDARLDLHGLTQSAAHVRLRRFLEDGQAEGARLILVITGKGGTAAETDFGPEARGVLRRAVPAWLESAEFRHLVAGFDEAGRRHGGSGALYVRIRRRR